MAKKIFGATKEDIAETEKEYGDLLDNPGIERFTDWILPNSASELDNESILNFEEKHGESFYKALREIAKN